MTILPVLVDGSEIPPIHKKRPQKNFKPLKTIKRIYDEHLVDYMLKIMLVHFMTREVCIKGVP